MKGNNFQEIRNEFIVTRKQMSGSPGAVYKFMNESTGKEIAKEVISSYPRLSLRVSGINACKPRKPQASTRIDYRS